MNKFIKFLLGGLFIVFLIWANLPEDSGSSYVEYPIESYTEDVYVEPDEPTESSPEDISVEFVDISGTNEIYVPEPESPAVTSICQVCHGVGNCVTCGGSGVYSNYGNSSTCSACSGSGKCWSCNGTGE